MISIKFHTFIFLFLIPTVKNSYSQKQKSISPIYYPPPNEWKKQTPEQAHIDASKLKAAIEFAIANEVSNPRSMEQNHYQTFGREPFGEAIGPLKDRGVSTGVIIKDGYLISSWGEPDRPDMTHSVTKSFLSTVAGLAFDRGLIRNINDTVKNYIAPILILHNNKNENKADHYGREQFLNLFDTPHNSTITWDHLLRQTSDWEGTLWGKPDWADRPGEKPSEWITRKRNLPGSVFEYNDVRVNVFSLAVLMIWRRPLPVVLRENIMDPIGASPTWRWYGYENSWVVLDGQAIQSVSGGGHWGGGMIINAYDMARFGYLMLRKGKWNERQLITEAWIKMAQTPTSIQPTYGFMNWYLNTEKKYLPNAPANAVVHAGNGTNIIYVDIENDLVVVCRWIDNRKVDEFIKQILMAINH